MAATYLLLRAGSAAARALPSAAQGSPAPPLLQTLVRWASHGAQKSLPPAVYYLRALSTASPQLLDLPPYPPRSTRQSVAPSSRDPRHQSFSSGAPIDPPRDTSAVFDPAMVKATERLLSSSPSSLYSPRDTGRAKEAWETSTWGRALLWLGGYYSKESQAVRGGKRMFDIVMEHARDADVRKGLMIGDSFPSMQGFIALHVWLCLTRLRQEQGAGKEVQQTLYDLFQEDVEARVRAAGVKVRISKWLAELEQRFFGAALSYDKALAITDMVESKEAMTEALWKNVYNAEGDKTAASMLQRYVRRELACLAMTDSQAILDGQFRFSHPGQKQSK